MALHRWVRAGGVVAVTTAVAVMVPATAHAGGPGSWTALSSYPASGFPRMGNNDVPTVLRGSASQLQVLWKREPASNASQYRTALVRPQGTTAVPERDVLGQWSTLLGAPRLRWVGGERFLLFGTADTTAPASRGGGSVTGQGRVATSLDGLTWVFSPQVASATTAFRNGNGQDVVDVAGSPLTISNGAGSTTTVDSGLFSPFPAAPATPTVTFQAPGTLCCSERAAIERDGATGVVWGAFVNNSNAAPAATRGVQYATVQPAVGTFRQVPGTLVNGGVVDPKTRVSLAARVGGGVYLATPVGYPAVSGIRVLRLGTSTSIFIPAPNVHQVSIAAAPGGRMWVSWIDRSGGTAVVRAVRSNPAGTAFGARTLVGRPASSTQLWQLTSDGAVAGLLDLVATSSAPSGAINVVHSQAKATLTATATLTRNRSGKVLVVRVTDAGVVVRGAAVTARGVTKRTGRLGTTAFAIPASVRGRIAVRVALAGYNGVTLTPRVG